MNFPNIDPTAFVIFGWSIKWYGISYAAGFLAGLTYAKYLAKTRAELSVLFYKGYKSLPRIFHLRTNISETVKNITLETEYVVAALYALSNIAMELIILLSISIFLLTVNYKVAVTSFIFLSIFSLMIYLLNSKVVSNMGKKSRDDAFY